MLAHRLAAAVLEGEDPKSFLKRVMPSMKIMPRPEHVYYELEAREEYDSPEDHFTDPDDAAFCHNQLARGNMWGWCCAHVMAKFTTDEGEEIVGDDWLGGCSYLSEEDFKQPGGYYDDMKKEAYAELCKKLAKLGYK